MKTEMPSLQTSSLVNAASPPSKRFHALAVVQ